MLACMIEIHDLDRGRKMLGGDIPNPRRAIAKDDFLSGSIPPTTLRFGIQATAKDFRSLHGAGVGGGVFFAHSQPSIIGCCLSDHAAEFCLSSVGGLAFNLTHASFGL